MSSLQFGVVLVTTVVLAVIGVWLIARLVFAAYFFTKRQYEERIKHHG